jgi:hypothetical protein
VVGDMECCVDGRVEGKGTSVTAGSLIFVKLELMLYEYFRQYYNVIRLMMTSHSRISSSSPLHSSTFSPSLSKLWRKQGDNGVHSPPLPSLPPSCVILLPPPHRWTPLHWGLPRRPSPPLPSPTVGHLGRIPSNLSWAEAGGRSEQWSGQW